MNELGAWLDNIRLGKVLDSSVMLCCGLCWTGGTPFGENTDDGDDEPDIDHTHGQLANPPIIDPFYM
jgi:hypothetical protein